MDRAHPQWPFENMETLFRATLSLECLEHLVGRERGVGHERIATLQALGLGNGRLIALKAQAQSAVPASQFVFQQPSRIG